MTPRRQRTARPVPSEAYTEEYFRTAEAGFHRWEESGGAEFGGFYEQAFAIRAPRSGERVLDLGTGRGEIPVLAAERGAIGVGLDYAAASMDLARVTLHARGAPAGAGFVRAEAGRMPFADASFDAAYAMDLIEHLTPGQLASALSELRRVLRRDAVVVVHTMPNRLIYDVTYRAMRLAALAVGRRWPRDPRHPFEHAMHVNEMRRGDVARVLRAAGLTDVRVWVGAFWYAHFLPSRRARALFERMARSRPLRPLASGEIWATARRP